MQAYFFSACKNELHYCFAVIFLFQKLTAAENVCDSIIVVI